LEEGDCDIRRTVQLTQEAKTDTATTRTAGPDGQAGIEYIAPPIASPFASGIENESKTGFLKGIRFSWKALVSFFTWPSPFGDHLFTGALYYSGSFWCHNAILLQYWMNA